MNLLWVSSLTNEQYKQRIERCIDEHLSSENVLGKANDYNFSHFDCYHIHMGGM